jgi:predicted CXXCH cytochrome family protein
VSSSKTILGLLAVFLLALAATVLIAAGARGTHPADNACGTCHVGGDVVNPAQASKLIASQEQLCVKCHQSAVKVSHPSGFVPQRALPPEFPLDWKGDLTCSTCHLTHGSAPGLLRGNKRGKEFCLSCHEATFFSRMKDAGTSVVTSGHMQLGRSSTDIDSHSLHCLGCHTAGSYAGGGSVSLGKNGIVKHASGAAAHPIGRVYKNFSRNADYRPENELAQRNIMLSDGKISCVSCHEVYKKEHGKLVMTMDRSALCLACHTK